MSASHPAGRYSGLEFFLPEKQESHYQETNHFYYFLLFANETLIDIGDWAYANYRGGVAGRWR